MSSEIELMLSKIDTPSIDHDAIVQQDPSSDRGSERTLKVTHGPEGLWCLSCGVVEALRLQLPNIVPCAKAVIIRNLLRHSLAGFSSGSNASRNRGQ